MPQPGHWRLGRRLRQRPCIAERDALCRHDGNVNYISIQTLAGPGDEIVVMTPNYMLVWGTAQNFGAQVKSLPLREDQGWALDLDALNTVVTERTKLIAVCNPNNPTGYILTEAEMDAIVAAAERVGAWLLADEVYSGAEQKTDTETPSFWGRYDKVLALNSLSKAYGLPGLRIGWVVGPVEMVEALWRRHEYTTIARLLPGGGGRAVLAENLPLNLQRIIHHWAR